MKSNEYWKRRKAQRMFGYMDSAEYTSDKISDVYVRASRHLNNEIETIFERFQAKHRISEKEAYKLLNTLEDSTSITEMIAKLKTGLPSLEKQELVKLIESQAYRARIDKLQEIQQEIDLLMKNVYQQEKKLSTAHYVSIANESYMKSAFDIQQMAGYGFNFSTVSPSAVDKILKSKWSGDNYSKRIWKNTKALSKDLKEELLINVMTGRTNKEVANIIQNKFAQSASNARRLVRTESCYVANEMEMVSYEALGLDTYRYVATLDGRTSEKCQDLDGQRFKVKEREPGKNCPPMHPWCRSTTICDITDEELKGMERRARNPKTGKSETVPADMTYKQWSDKYAVTEEGK